MADILADIAKGRIMCLRDMEEPRDLILSAAIEYEFKKAMEPYMCYQRGAEYEAVMGMRIEWVRPGTAEISIRTNKGDVRIVRRANSEGERK